MVGSCTAFLFQPEINQTRFQFPLINHLIKTWEINIFDRETPTVDFARRRDHAGWYTGSSLKARPSHFTNSLFRLWAVHGHALADHILWSMQPLGTEHKNPKYFTYLHSSAVALLLCFHSIELGIDIYPT